MKTVEQFCEDLGCPSMESTICLRDQEHDAEKAELRAEVERYARLAGLRGDENRSLRARLDQAEGLLREMAAMEYCAGADDGRPTPCGTCWWCRAHAFLAQPAGQAGVVEGAGAKTQVSVVSSPRDQAGSGDGLKNQTGLSAPAPDATCAECGQRKGENGEHDFLHPFRAATSAVQVGAPKEHVESSACPVHGDGHRCDCYRCCPAAPSTDATQSNSLLAPVWEAIGQLRVAGTRADMEAADRWRDHEKRLAALEGFSGAATDAMEAMGLRVKALETWRAASNEKLPEPPKPGGLHPAPSNKPPKVEGRHVFKVSFLGGTICTAKINGKRCGHGSGSPIHDVPPAEGRHAFECESGYAGRDCKGYNHRCACGAPFSDDIHVHDVPPKPSYRITPALGGLHPAPPPEPPKVEGRHAFECSWLARVGAHTWLTNFGTPGNCDPRNCACAECGCYHDVPPAEGGRK